MRVKTFTGTHREAIDSQVNHWLSATKVVVLKTDIALKPLRERGWDAIAGKATTRRALAIAITVWYDDSYDQKPNPRPANWTFDATR